MVNILELERLAWPTFSLVTSFVSGLLFLVAMATPAWFKIDLYHSGQGVGNITAGLIQGRQIISGDTADTLLVDATFYTYERFSDVISLTSLYILLVCLILTIPLSLANMAFEFVNTYQVVKEWWRGPATIYVISLLVVILASLSVAVYSDFYLIDLSDPTIKHQIINSSRSDVNLDKYTGTASIQYSAYIFFVGATICVLPLLFSWRLTVLLPVFYTTDAIKKYKYEVPDKYEMEEIIEEEEEEEDQFIMAEKTLDSEEGSNESADEGSGEESEEHDSEEHDSEEEEESEDDDENDDETDGGIDLDSYRFPATENRLQGPGFLTYQ